MDEYTNFLWSYFPKTKDEQVPTNIQHINMIQNEPKAKVKYICCDNAGGNHDVQNYLRESSFKIRWKFEFTAPDSTQQKGNIERKFATLYGRVTAILNGTEFTPLLRKAMWDFCSLHATRLDNLLLRPDTHLLPYVMDNEETPIWTPCLRAFGDNEVYHQDIDR
jgi:hypothetical protein